MQRLRPLMFVFPPFDFLDDERIQTELLEGGVRDLLFAWGRLYDERSDESDARLLLNLTSRGRFVDRFFAASPRGRSVAPPFAATPDLYAGLGATPPELAPHLVDKAARLATLIEQLSTRGFRVYYFGYIGAGPDGPATWTSDEARRVHLWDYVAARYRDFCLHYPSLAGFVTDGPGFGYEITSGFQHGGQLFAPLPTDQEHQDIASRLGVRLDQMQAASDRTQRLLQGLTPAQVDLFLDAEQGVFDAIDLLIEDPALLDLLRFKTAVVDQQIGGHSRAIKAIDPRLEYGICPRLPCFATIQGVNFRRLSQLADFLQSKHYLWMHGFDGFRGTLDRYARTLGEWNPELDRARIEALIFRLLGVQLPVDYGIADFEGPAPKSFFDEIVYRESRKMLLRVGDPARISPFIGQEHEGIWLSPQELRHLFQAMVDAGLTRFTYYVLNTISDEVWDVLTEFTAD
ncbi:MAG: hypothetical protein ACRDIY_20955 [Chloroflexota bacterium]